jgi:uncharacterized protein
MKAWLMMVAACAAAACGSQGVTQPPKVIPRNPDVAAAKEKEPEPKSTAVTETWWATIVSPNNLVDLVITFRRASDAPSAPATATMAVPARRIDGVALTDVSITPELIRFTLPKKAPLAPEEYALLRRGDEAEGEMRIGDAGFFIRMVRQEPGAPERIPIQRPQTPQPPYPYNVREVSFPAPGDGVLAGSLTLPAGTGPFPAVVLISGSGLQDRDQTIFGHRTFLVLADHLTRAGFAVLRVDDRGIGASKGTLGTLETDIGDARAAFEWMAAQPEIDGKRVGLIGHSVGGVIAPIVAARTGKVAFVVALAGPGLPGWELVPLQLAATMDAQGIKPEVAEKLAAAQRKVGKAMVSGKPDAVKAALRASFVDAAAATGHAPLTDAQLDAAVTAKLPEVQDPWTISFFKEDPRPAWRKVKVPVLALWGDKDLPVPAAANMKEVTAALKKNRDVTTKILPGLNHLYQHAPSGTVEEYARLEETFDLQTLRAIESWMSERMVR